MERWDATLRTNLEETPWVETQFDEDWEEATRLGALLRQHDDQGSDKDHESGDDHALSNSNPLSLGYDYVDGEHEEEEEEEDRMFLLPNKYPSHLQLPLRHKRLWELCGYKYDTEIEQLNVHYPLFLQNPLDSYTHHGTSPHRVIHSSVVHSDPILNFNICSSSISPSETQDDLYGVCTKGCQDDQPDLNRNQRMISADLFLYDAREHLISITGRSLETIRVNIDHKWLECRERMYIERMERQMVSKTRGTIQTRFNVVQTG